MLITANETFLANNWSDISQLSLFHGIKNLQILLYLLISVIGTTGNILVCRAIMRCSTKKTNELFILNLAITDISTSLLSVPLDLAELIKGHFPFGSVFCNLVYPFQTLLMIVSVMTLLFMSVERYRAIATPLKRRIPSNAAKVSILISWLFAVACVAPYATVLDFKDKACIEVWRHDSHRKVFTLTIFMLFYLVPLSVISICYIRTMVILFKTLRNVQKLLGAKNMKTWNLGKRRARQNLRTVKIFVIAVVAFACCLLPTHVLWLWHDFGNGRNFKHFGIVIAFSNIMIYSNSVINPFIFGKINLTTCLKSIGTSKITSSFRNSGFVLRTREISFRNSFRSSTKVREIQEKSDWQYQYIVYVTSV